MYPCMYVHMYIRIYMIVYAQCLFLSSSRIYLKTRTFLPTACIINFNVNHLNINLFIRLQTDAILSAYHNTVWAAVTHQQHEEDRGQEEHRTGDRSLRALQGRWERLCVRGPMCRRPPAGHHPKRGCSPDAPPTKHHTN